MDRIKSRKDVWDKKDEIIRLYVQDLLSCENIAKKYNCSMDIIYKMLRKNNALMGASKRRKLLAKAGKLKIWNRDLTKETDERIRLSGEEHKNKFWKNSKDIIKLYKDELCSTKKIAEKYNCDSTTIYNILRGNEIFIGGKERRRLLYKNGKIKSWNKGLTKETDERIKNSGTKISKASKGKKRSEETKRQMSTDLKRLYQEGKRKSWNKRNDLRNKADEIIRFYKDELLSKKEIGKRYNCSPEVINSILKENGIVISRLERSRLLNKMGKLKIWNRREDISTKEVLNLYFDKKMSCPDISKKLKCSIIVIMNRIQREGHKIRSISESHKLKPCRYWLGKKCPEYMIKKNRDSKLQWWRENKDKEKGKNILSNLGSGQDYSGDKNPFYNKKHTEETKKIIREARAKQIFPIKDSKPELKVQSFCRLLKLEYLTHCYMNIEHAYQCDILINPQPNFMAEKKTILELDGDWWHGNPKKYPIPNQMQKEQIEEDACRNEELRAEGFNVIRLWENDIKKMSLEEFKQILFKKLNKFHEIIK